MRVAPQAIYANAWSLLVTVWGRDRRYSLVRRSMSVEVGFGVPRAHARRTLGLFAFYL